MSCRVLAVDTSSYTTSVAVVGPQGEVEADFRQLLPVPAGQLGLRQSEAVFKHLEILPGLLLKAICRRPSAPVGAVAVARRPTRDPDSYLPVFRVGEGFARTLSGAWRCPLYGLSHQDGHLWAALGPSGPPADSFLFLHLSGGTTHLYLITARGPASCWRWHLLGGGMDLHAGQMVDRVGVALGLAFPAGAELELLSGSSRGEVRVPSAVRGYQASFAGPTTHALRLLQRGAAPADVAWAVQRCIANTVEKLLRKAREELDVTVAVVAGGVAANRQIRQRLRRRLQHRALGMRLLFPPADLCTDNAVGLGWAAQACLRSLRSRWGKEKAPRM